MGFFSGALGQIGEQVRQKTLMDQAIEHEANQQLSQHLFNLGEQALKEKPENAPDFFKAAYAIQTTPLGKKPPKWATDVQGMLFKQRQQQYGMQTEIPPPPQHGNMPDVPLDPNNPEAGTLDASFANVQQALVQEAQKAAQQQQIQQAQQNLQSQQQQSQAPPPVSGLPSPGFNSIMPAPPGSIPFPTLPGMPGGTSGFAGPVSFPGNTEFALLTPQEKAVMARQEKLQQQRDAVDFARSLGITDPREIANFLNKQALSTKQAAADKKYVTVGSDQSLVDPETGNVIYAGPGKGPSGAAHVVGGYLVNDKGEVLFATPPGAQPERNVPVDQQAFKGYLDKAGGDPVKAFQLMEADKEKLKPASENTGTWSVQEDEQGKPILFNSKTGATRPATGIQKVGTKDKKDTAIEKEIGPARDALSYADTYVNRGTFTGTGDEALLEKFFELARPSTGFRMTKQQTDLLQNSRSWKESVAGKARHIATGTWFTDKQRQEIAQTMRDLANSKMALAKANAGSMPAPPKSGPEDLRGVSTDELLRRLSGGK